MKPFIISKLSFLILVLLLLNCSRKSGTEPIYIKFWAMGAEGEHVKKLVPEFEQVHPNIRVKVQMIPWTAAQEKLITAFASDNLPDVFQLGNTWIPQFVALRALEWLDPWIEKTRMNSPEHYFKGIWNTNQIKGKVYGIPWYIDTRILFYRKDVLKQAGFSSPPKTWNELLTVCRRIKNLYKNEKKYPIYLPTNEWAPFIIFGLENGARLLKDNNCYGAFSEPEFVEAYSFLSIFYKEKLTPLSLSEVTNIYQAFAEGFINMYISGPWNIPEFKKWMKGSLRNRWSTAPIPGKKRYPGISLAGGSSLVINKKSRQKKAAWEFIQYLSTDKVQIKFYQLTNDLPAKKEAWANPVLKNDSLMKAFYIQFQHVKSTPKVPEWEQIVFSKLQEYNELMARGILSPRDALKKLDQDVNNILSKRRWLISRKKNEGNPLDS